MIEPCTNRRRFSLLYGFLHYLDRSRPLFSHWSGSFLDAMAGEIQLDRAIDEIQRRRQGPPLNIDFTQHKLGDGTIVSTQERVVKEVFSFSF